MSTGRKQANQATTSALQAAGEASQLRAQSEARLAKEKEKSQRLFIRSLRARLGGGFFDDQSPTSTLG